MKCHGVEKPKGDLSLVDIAGAAAEGGDLAKWTAIAERLKAGDMPPEGEKQPSPESLDAITDWIDAELMKAGKTGALKPGSLKTGNHVPHEWLFDPNASFPLDNPPRLWRMSPQIYQALATDFNKNGKFSQPFALPAGEGFKDQAGSLGIDGSTAAQLLRNAELFVDDQLGLNPNKAGAGKKVAEFLPLLNATSPATKAQIETALQKQFEFALKRKATSEELGRFVEFHAQNVKTGGVKNGSRVTLMTVLMLPEAVFRMELGGGNPAERSALTPRELAFAIAYGPQAGRDRPRPAGLCPPLLPLLDRPRREPGRREEPASRGRSLPQERRQHEVPARGVVDQRFVPLSDTLIFAARGVAMTPDIPCDVPLQRYAASGDKTRRCV